MCLEFSFHDSSYYAAVSLSPHWSILCCKQRGKNYKFQKLHYPLEQDYDLKKISSFQKINLQVCTFWQRPHLTKYASKRSHWPWPLWSVFACTFLQLWTSTCQVSLCLYKNVVNEIKPSQLKNFLVLVDLINTIGCLG